MCYYLGTLDVMYQGRLGEFSQHKTKIASENLSENTGVPVLFRRYNLPTLVEIGFTDLPKFGDARHPKRGNPFRVNPLKYGFCNKVISER
jgi:hypothetical protein